MEHRGPLTVADPERTSRTCNPALNHATPPRKIGQITTTLTRPTQVGNPKPPRHIRQPRRRLRHARRPTSHLRPQHARSPVVRKNPGGPHHRGQHRPNGNAGRPNIVLGVASDPRAPTTRPTPFHPRGSQDPVRRASGQHLPGVRQAEPRTGASRATLPPVPGVATSALPHNA